jgi:cysteinyl-tRNA synthetase
MPLFTPLNTFDSYLVKEPNMRDVDDKIIKDAFKDALSFTNPFRSLPKE